MINYREIDRETIEIEGYVNGVDRWSRELNENGRKFYEKIKPGSFARAIDQAKSEGRNIVALFNHDSSKMLSEDIELEEDSIGLKTRFTIKKDNPNFSEVLNSMERKRLQGFSFAFNEPKYNEIDENHLELERFRLLEISLLNVTPAYYGTVVSARDQEAEQKHLRFDNQGEEGDAMEELLKELIAEVKGLREALVKEEPKEDKEEPKEDKEEPKEEKPEEKPEEPKEVPEEKAEEVKDKPKEESKDEEESKEEQKEEDPEEDEEEKEKNKKRSLAEKQLSELF